MREGPFASALRRLRARPRREAPASDAAPVDPVALDPAVAEVEPPDREIVERAIPHTMTGVPRLRALIDAVRHCEREAVPGAFAECGVWRGGSVLAMILTLQQAGKDDRDIYLFDTFEGMTEPTEHDTSRFHPPALELWKESNGRPWPELFDPKTFNEAEVSRLLAATGYPADRLNFVRGAVEETLPAAAPEMLALLRLDTDWYRSTRHELVHLYPRLAPGGVLIIDDYGHFDGCRQAVDEYLADQERPPALRRVDYAARIAFKE